MTKWYLAVSTRSKSLQSSLPFRPAPLRSTTHSPLHKIASSSSNPTRNLHGSIPPPKTCAPRSSNKAGNEEHGAVESADPKPAEGIPSAQHSKCPTVATTHATNDPPTPRGQGHLASPPPHPPPQGRAGSAPSFPPTAPLLFRPRFHTH